MRRIAASWLLAIGILLALSPPAVAKTWTLAWDPVTSYADNTSIASGTAVLYNAYWTTDPALSAASLRPVGTNLLQPSVAFDPYALGMTAGQAVWFTANDVTGTETSALSAALPWTVPTLSSLSLSGPSSLNGGGSAVFSATGAWSDNTFAAVTPAWSVSPSTYASISAAGVLSASPVPASQAVTVTATLAAGGVTRTASRAVTIAFVAPALASLSVAGPATVTEGGTGTFSAVATFGDNSSATVSPTWSVSPSTYASISAAGVLAAGNVTADQAVTVTATYASGGVTRTASKGVTIAYAAPALSSLSVSGPATVAEGSTGTFSAVATFGDNTTTTVSPTWSVSPSAYASISAAGVLAAGNVTADQAVTVTATYSSGGVTRTASKGVTVAYAAPALSTLSVSGPASVSGGSTGTFTAAAAWSDNTTTPVSPAWSVSPSTYASISSAGVLTAASVTANQSVTVTATYSSGGVTRTATKAVTIASAAKTLASLAVAGPSSLSSGATATYTATASWSDNTASPVTATWSVSPAGYATVSPAGVLTAGAVTAPQAVTITAAYSSGGVTRTASLPVTLEPAVRKLAPPSLKEPTLVK
jgi:hypothetical protein